MTNLSSLGFQPSYGPRNCGRLFRFSRANFAINIVELQRESITLSTITFRKHSKMLWKLYPAGDPTAFFVLPNFHLCVSNYAETGKNYSFSERNSTSLILENEGLDVSMLSLVVNGLSMAYMGLSSLQISMYCC